MSKKFYGKDYNEKNNIVRKSKAMCKDYIISFKQKDNKFRVLDGESLTVSTKDVIPRDIKKFKMLTVNDNEATDAHLFEYAKMFRGWCKELYDDKECSFYYSKCFSDYTAVTIFFNNRCDYKNHKNISPTEYKWFEQCANYGIQYLQKENTKVSGYGYDFKNQYGLALHSDYKIPTKEGAEETLKKLPKKSADLRHGFYKVKITCANDDFKKVFAYSKHNVYLCYSLAFAMDNKKKFGVEIELVQDKYPNAYLYEDEDLVTLKSITDKWFNDLVGLKKRYPKNRLIKHLFSSAWGHLNKANVMRVHMEEMQKLDVGCTMDHDYQIVEYHEYGKNIYWEVLNNNSPYKYNIRLKPWITAISRNMTAEKVLLDCDNVVRVHTDGIVYRNKMEFDDENFIAEDKTTGTIHWVNNNCYHNETIGYKSKGFDSYVKKND